MPSMPDLPVLKARLADTGKLARERLLARVTRPHPRPVFVFGNQKSGTSAISVLLGQATGLRTQMDFRGAWEPHLTPLVAGRIPLDAFIRRNAYAFSAPIVKEPGLTFLAGRLAAHYPGSPCIFILRDPFQNIRSIFNRLDLPGDITAGGFDPAGLPNATWRAIMTGRDLSLETGGDDETGGETGSETGPVAVQARRWLRAAAEYEADPGRYTLLRYEDFTRDKEGEIARLARAVGLEPRHSIAATKDRDFQRRGDAGADPRAFFGERNHALIARICGPAAARLGYGPVPA